MSSVSSFFSRDASLKRQARTFRARKHSRAASSPTHHLHIIQEEDERSSPPSSLPSPTRSSSSRSPSPLKKRHASISASDIYIVQQGEEVEDDMLLLSPRPAPRPPTPNSASPDSFRLTFTDVAFKFPHPPLPTPSCASPTPSMSSSSSMSSPTSEYMGLPTTPGSSDDEFAQPTLRRRRARGVEIKPLVIVKHHTSRIATQDPPSPVSECESDNEWYASQFSDLISMCNSHEDGPARPESMSLPPSLVLPFAQPKAAAPKRRRSRSNSVKSPPPPVPPIPAHLRSQSVTTITGDAEFRMSIPPRPLPAPPVVPVIIEPEPTSPVRPAPKADLPQDSFEDGVSEFSLSLYADAEEEVEVELASSQEASTPSIYSQFSADLDVEVDFDAPLMLPLSLPGSPIDFERDVVWEVRRRLGEVESIVDVNVDVPRLEVQVQVEQVAIPEVVVDEIPSEEESEEKKKKKEKRRPIQLNDVFVPSPCSSSLPRSPSPERTSYSLSPSPSSRSRYTPSSSPSPSSKRYAISPAPSTSSFKSNDSSFSSFSFPESTASAPSPLPLPNPHPEPQQVLRSKWSSSTLNSVHEEQSTARKLRALLGARASGVMRTPEKKRESGRAVSSPKSGSPKGSTTVWGAASGATRQWNDAARRHSRRTTTDGDVMVIGFNHPSVPSTPISPYSPYSPTRSASPAPSYSPGRSQYSYYAQAQAQAQYSPVRGGGLKRRGSTMSNSSSATTASSAESCASSAGGLRRKPIPVEMFLRA